MDLHIINNNEELIDVMPRGKGLLEISKTKSEGRPGWSMNFFNPENNSISEISPELEKPENLPVYNCVFESRSIFFASRAFDSAKEECIICLYRYDEMKGSSEMVLSFPEESEEDNVDIKIFALSDNQFLVQTEQQNSEKTESLMGNIKFALRLYNSDTEKVIEVTDQNLINNGINAIIPVKGGNLLLKTGFSFLEDDRISGTSEKEALIEGVYFGSMSLFVASVGLESATSRMKLITTAYFEKCILKPEVCDDYVYFTIYSQVDRKSETVFYDFVNDLQIVYRNEEADIGNLGSPCVINNIPYIYMPNEGKTGFFNLKTSETDCVFYEEKFVKVLGGVFIFYKTRGNNNYVRFYRHPKLDLIHEEKGYYRSSCVIGQDYYIYVSDEPKNILS